VFRVSGDLRLRLWPFSSPTAMRKDHRVEVSIRRQVNMLSLIYSAADPEIAPASETFSRQQTHMRCGDAPGL